MTESVLIVCPMRAQSQGVWRKNLRELNSAGATVASEACLAVKNLGQRLRSDGHDVTMVIATDSATVGGLAEAYGLGWYDRNAQNATDNAGIQEVVLEVHELHKTDVVVLLQSTSPHLMTSTAHRIARLVLDDLDMDSAASVTPVDALAWRGIGDVSPLFAERENRQLRQQQEPEVLAETGGVQVVRNFPRFDGPLGAYLIGESHALEAVYGVEGMDIDTNDDLQIARNYSSTGRVLLYVVAAERWGTGHLRRAFDLATELELRNAVDIYCADLSPRQQAEVVPRRWLRDQLPHFKDYDLVVMDCLDLFDYQLERMADFKKPVVMLEHEVMAVPGVVTFINELHTPSPQWGSLAGPSLATIRSDFKGWPDPVYSTDVEQVLIAIGGNDAAELTAAVVAQAGAVFPNAKLVTDFDPEGYPAEIFNADLVICGMGRAMYEIAYMGRPFLAIAQHEREASHHRLEGGLYHGPFDGPDITPKLTELADCNGRVSRSVTLRTQVDGHGLATTVGILNDIIRVN